MDWYSVEHKLPSCDSRCSIFCYFRRSVKRRRAINFDMAVSWRRKKYTSGGRYSKKDYYNDRSRLTVCGSSCKRGSGGGYYRRDECVLHHPSLMLLLDHTSDQKVFPKNSATYNSPRKNAVSFLLLLLGIILDRFSVLYWWRVAGGLADGIPQVGTE